MSYSNEWKNGNNKQKVNEQSIHVVLVDEQDNILGIEEKLKAHNSDIAKS